MSGGDAPFMRLVVLLFFVGGLIVLGWNCYHDAKQYRERAALRGEGREAIGEVTGFSISRIAPTSVIYRFTVNGVTYSGKATESAAPVRGLSLEKSDKINIRYLPFNPAVNHPSGWEWSAAIGWYFTVLWAFLWTIGAVVLAGLWRDRQLARQGKVVAGIVTNCKRTDRTFRVEYEFRTDDGVSLKGNCECLDEYGTGARVWVLYLPQKPRRNHTYPMSFYSVVE